MSDEQDERPWYDDEGAIGRDRLQKILAGIEALPPPLTRRAAVKLLMACYRAQGYIEFGGYQVTKLASLKNLLFYGHVTEGRDYDYVEEAFLRLEHPDH